MAPVRIAGPSLPLHTHSRRTPRPIEMLGCGPALRTNGDGGMTACETSAVAGIVRHDDAAAQPDVRLQP